MLVLTQVGKEWRVQRVRASLWPCDIPPSPQHRPCLQAQLPAALRQSVVHDRSLDTGFRGQQRNQQQPGDEGKDKRAKGSDPPSATPICSAAGKCVHNLSGPSQVSQRNLDSSSGEASYQ